MTFQVLPISSSSNWNRSINDNTHHNSDIRRVSVFPHSGRETIEIIQPRRREAESQKAERPAIIQKQRSVKSHRAGIIEEGLLLSVDCRSTGTWPR